MFCDEMDASEWGHAYFSKQCYFYSGRDCPGWELGRMCGRIHRRIPVYEGEAMAESADPYKGVRAIIKKPVPITTCPLTIFVGQITIKAVAVVESNDVSVYLEEDDRSRTLQSLIETRVITGLKITPIVEEAVRAEGPGRDT